MQLWVKWNADRMTTGWDGVPVSPFVLCNILHFHRRGYDQGKRYLTTKIIVLLCLVRWGADGLQLSSSRSSLSGEQNSDLALVSLVTKHPISRSDLVCQIEGKWLEAGKYGK
jgi:hypothetical protein